jgi:glutathione S-transferase
VTEPHLLPEGPIERALERGWIAHASTLLGNLFELMMAQDATGYDAAVEELGEGLEPMERFLEPKPLFRGASFSLADAAFAPLFMRLELCHGLRPLPVWGKLPKLRAWSQALGALPEVRESVAPAFADDLTEWLRESGSYLARGR